MDVLMLHACVIAQVPTMSPPHAAFDEQVTAPASSSAAPSAAVAPPPHPKAAAAATVNANRTAPLMSPPPSRRPSHGRERGGRISRPAPFAAAAEVTLTGSRVG